MLSTLDIDESEIESSIQQGRELGSADKEAAQQRKQQKTEESLALVDDNESNNGEAAIALSLTELRTIKESAAYIEGHESATQVVLTGSTDKPLAPVDVTPPENRDEEAWYDQM